MDLKLPCGIFFVFCLMLFSSSCSDSYKTVYNGFVFVDPNNLKDDSLIKDTVSNLYFSRLTRPNSFGRMFVYKLSDQQIGKEFWMVFSGKTRTNFAQSNASIVVLAHDKKKYQLCWSPVFLRRHYTDINKWCYFKDSIKLLHSYEWKNPAVLSSVVYYGGPGVENFDMDSLKVTIKEIF